VGALDPAAVRRTLHAVAGRRPVSAIAGAFPPDPAVVVKAAAAMAETGVDYVMVGFLPGPGGGDCIEALAPLAAQTKLMAVLFADRGADFDLVGVLADCGFAGAMLDTAGTETGSLLCHMTPERLEEFVSLGRAKGLTTGLAGSLEPPDVPRLLPLKPDILGFRGAALCRNDDRRSTLDPHSVSAIRVLIPRQGDAEEPQPRGEPELGAHDRIFVRDLVLPVSIGAYRRERETAQRVRFDVVAEVARRGSTADDMAGVFSYDVIIDAIRMLVASGHVNLVETLAEEIAGRVLGHAQVRSVTVRIEKLDVGPGGVGIEIVRRRGEGRSPT
jgi:dihydroneopterin aldolase